MTLGSRGQLHVYVLCMPHTPILTTFERAKALGNYVRAYIIWYVLMQIVSKCHQAILHQIEASRAYTLRAKHVHGSVPYTSSGGFRG